jgi:hypothetical protein
MVAGTDLKHSKKLENNFQNENVNIKNTNSSKNINQINNSNNGNKDDSVDGNSKFTSNKSNNKNNINRTDTESNNTVDGADLGTSNSSIHYEIKGKAQNVKGKKGTNEKTLPINTADNISISTDNKLESNSTKIGSMSFDGKSEGKSIDINSIITDGKSKGDAAGNSTISADGKSKGNGKSKIVTKKMIKRKRLPFRLVQIFFNRSRRVSSKVSSFRGLRNSTYVVTLTTSDPNNFTVGKVVKEHGNIYAGGSNNESTGKGKSDGNEEKRWTNNTGSGVKNTNEMRGTGNESINDNIVKDRPLSPIMDNRSADDHTKSGKSYEL